MKGRTGLSYSWDDERRVIGLPIRVWVLWVPPSKSLTPFSGVGVMSPVLIVSLTLPILGELDSSWLVGCGCSNTTLSRPALQMQSVDVPQSLELCSHTPPLVRSYRLSLDQLTL